ncbi:MAG TPA: thioredoxin family protein [Burkholderiaceae bacterium]|nr:thioredoxin family protein [Burkholderiaceae bacterium]
MTALPPYDSAAPTRAEVDAWPGLAVLDFGANWCGHCQAAQPALMTALSAHPGVRHLRLEDGKGRPLGRSYGVKLWPTLILLRNGQEVARLVRPTAVEQVNQFLAQA